LPDPNTPHQHGTTDLVAETFSKISFSRIELVAATGEFLYPFALLKTDRLSAGNHPNFHGEDRNAIIESGVIPSELFECRAGFITKNRLLGTYFDVDAVFSLKLR